MLTAPPCPRHRPCRLGGIDEQPVEEIVRLLERERFNAVRLPLAVDAVNSPPDGGCMPIELRAGSRLAGTPLSFVIGSHHDRKAGYGHHNPTWVGLSYLDEVKQLVTLLGKHRILVMLDLHAMVAGKWPDDGKIG